MTISLQLMKAFLAMDSYSRGYEASLDVGGDAIWSTPNLEPTQYVRIGWVYVLRKRGWRGSGSPFSYERTVVEI